MDTLTLGIVTDLHFGPEARWQGKLRKLTHRAPVLLRDVIRVMNDEVKPDMLVNLGDDIEDESPELDLVRYAECQSILRTSNARLVNVAGNHDTIHLGRAALNRIWQREEASHLYYSFDHGGWHFVVLHTAERQDKDVRIPAQQIAWLRDDLRAASAPTIVLMHHSASEQDLEDSRWFAGRAHVALVEERADVRRVFEESGKVAIVFNGHLHRNHFDVIRGIPYVTIQSLIENLEDDAPGVPAAAHAVVRLSRERIVVRVRGNDTARYQVELDAALARR
jgi:3',5'-cyclic AMP phosphodiesterase CpdA